MADKKLKLFKDYYDVGYSLYKKHSVTIHPGLTILVGCNGSGKTTFLRMCNDILKNKKDTLVIEYSNLHDGGNLAKDRAALGNDMAKLARLTLGSEGEAMAENLGTLVHDIGMKIRRSGAQNIWLLLDAMDSGYSIGNVVEMKGFFSFLQEHEAEKNIYILMPANAYELARGERCLDVQEMEYIDFESYEDFRTFVMQSREKRDRLSVLG